MKIKSTILIIVAALGLASCTGNLGNYKPGATGTPGEVLVVLNKDYWTTEVGDSLRAVFHAYCESTPMEEYLFNLVQIPKEQFIDINQRHRNVLVPVISTEFTKAEILINKEPYAFNQTLIKLQAPDAPSMVKLISDNRSTLIELFKKADSDRWLQAFVKYQNLVVAEQIQKKYHVKMVIPKSYALDVSRDDFAWISYETRKYDMGIFIYSYPFTDTNTFSLDYLLKQRDIVLQKNVPGERDGSYMTTERVYDHPIMRIKNHKGNYAAAINGLWKMHRDFMGGPFVSITMADTLRNRIVTVEGFVYNPNEEVRNQVRQLETLLSTVEITAN
ncbi:MAG: DUF4837 family protein [Bacteroidales bacterium]|nr:DUF4837 family protein [Bacteroidales bacterium]